MRVGLGGEERREQGILGREKNEDSWRVCGCGSLTGKGVLAVGIRVSTLQTFLLTAFSWLLYCWLLSEVAQTGTGLAEKKGLIYTLARPFTLERQFLVKGKGVEVCGSKEWGRMKGWGQRNTLPMTRCC